MIRRSSLLLVIFLATMPSFLSGQTVHVITIDATVNPATAEYIHHSIEKAVSGGAECLVIQLNTPGGLLKSTRDIVSDLLTAPLPILVYVSPAGAQAASAGTFIVLASHVAAMAPGTNIGAAHPVGMQGGEKDSVMNEKATNDAAAFIRTISEKRSRNVHWAEDAVRQSISITETEALRDSVIDIIAPTVAELVRLVDGRQVIINGSPRTLHTAGASIQQFEMGWKYRLLDILSDPNVAYIFFLLGLYGLLFELYNPGAILPGVVGVIALILAFYSLHTLPVNYAGLALIVFGVILFLLEVKIVSHGILAAGGVASLLLGSVMLIDTESPLEIVSLSWTVILPAVLCTAAFFLFAVGMGIRAQKRTPVTGAEGIVGEEGICITTLSPIGQVRVHGEIWNATTHGNPIPAGSAVRVERMEGLRLVVRRAGSPTT